MAFEISASLFSAGIFWALNCAEAVMANAKSVAITVFVFIFNLKAMRTGLEIN